MAQSETPLPISLATLLNVALDFLQDKLPPPIYNFAYNFVSHALSLFFACFQLVSSLAAKDPREWDAQTVLPPLISIFIAYMAILSIYRTTTWMIRTGFWFAKWGGIFAILMASMGYLAGNAPGDGNQDFMTSILNMMSGKVQAPPPGTRKPYTSQRRPKAWDSFKSHENWQYQQEANQDESNSGDFVQYVAGLSEQILGDQTWWKMAKGVFAGGSQDGSQAETKQNRNTKYSKSR